MYVYFTIDKTIKVRNHDDRKEYSRIFFLELEKATHINFNKYGLLCKRLLG